MPGPGKLPLVGGAIALAPESNFWWLLLLLLSLIILILIYIKIRLDRSRLDPLERKVRKRLLKGKTTSKIREEFIGKRWSEADLKTVFWRIDAANQLIEYYPLTWGTLKQLKRFVYLSSKEGLAKEWIIRSLVHGGWNETLIEYFVSAHYELLV